MLQGLSWKLKKQNKEIERRVRERENNSGENVGKASLKLQLSYFWL